MWKKVSLKRIGLGVLMLLIGVVLIGVGLYLGEVIVSAAGAATIVAAA